MLFRTNSRFLEGKGTLGTGSSSGGGRDTALELAESGASVVVNEPSVVLNGDGIRPPAKPVPEEIRRPARRANGLTIDEHGDLGVCQHFLRLGSEEQSLDAAVTV